MNNVHEQNITRTPTGMFYKITTMLPLPHHSPEQMFVNRIRTKRTPVSKVLFSFSAGQGRVAQGVKNNLRSTLASREGHPKATTKRKEGRS